MNRALRGMSPPGRPKGEYRKAQPEGTPVTRALHAPADAGPRLAFCPAAKQTVRMVFK
jgi:hypothetical protein